jgi:hypothetical protein
LMMTAYMPPRYGVSVTSDVLQNTSRGIPISTHRDTTFWVPIAINGYFDSFTM